MDNDTLEEGKAPRMETAQLVEALLACKLDKAQRHKLLGFLTQSRLPRESLPALVQALIETWPDKDQRTRLLTALTAADLPYDAVPALVRALSSIRLEREQRAAMLEALLRVDAPVEALPTLTQALIAARPGHELRAELLDYLVRQPLDRQTALEVFRGIVEHMGDEKMPEVEAMARRLGEWRDAHTALLPWVDPQRPAWRDGQAQALYRVVVDGVPAQEALLDMLCEGDLCYLADACMEFIDRKQLWLMFEEILFHEEYYCEFDTDAPLILDCGVNIGLAVYYAKHRYPHARIIGFEPWSVAYECAQRNVERNHWADVTLHKVALGPSKGVMQLTTVEENSLASTLTNRMDEYIAYHQAAERVEDVQVEPLSAYIDGPVDFLKMDIEGMEEQVLAELGDALTRVRWLFCEYHYGPKLANNSLVHILEMLERSGFVFEVAKSSAYSELTKARPFPHVGKVVSELVWARRADGAPGQ